ncbi:hypothetical protein ANCDUO_15955, partial [Ancylostoma duodenale]
LQHDDLHPTVGRASSSIGVMDNATELNDTASLLTHAALDCNKVDDYFLVPRFWLVVVFGVTISVISILFNSFIFVVFATSKQHRCVF